MRIFVCVKSVPDTNTTVKVGPDNRTINPAGVKYVMSPYDAVACSKAVELKDSLKAELVAVCVGSSKLAEANKRVNDALALGAERGILIEDEASHRDALGTAKALAAAIQAQGGHDIVLFGRAAVDTQALAVGPMVAQLLGIPFVGDVTELSVADGKATAKRLAEGRTETIEVSLPAAFSAQRGLAEEKYAKLKDILAAKKKPVTNFDFAFPAMTHEVAAMTPPPERKAGRIVGEGPAAAAELLRLLQEEAKSLSF
jgi:electron transfer flavoprotein beta subunit